jgi:hypothetical protein
VCVCAVLVQYDCWPPITTYGDYGFHETRGLLQRREGTTLVHQKEREPRERENDIAGWERGGGGAMHLDESGCLLWGFVLFFVLVFFSFRSECLLDANDSGTVL